MKKKIELSAPTMNEKGLLSISELMVYLSVGEGLAAKFGKEAGAVVKIGSRRLYDRKKIDDHIAAQGA